MQAVVTDGDGDTANLDLTLNVRDADGHPGRATR